MNILKDIFTGALPIGEIPGFVVWAIGKTFWFWFAAIVIGAVLLLGVGG